jgi:glucan 1,4-alpha-glucosidase
VSWIKPQKYVGIWWEMHVGKSTWDYAGSQNAGTAQGLVPTGKHGATTANTKRYIDFAAKNGFDGVLVEGWNVGWEDWFGKMKEEVFDFSKPYPDYDMDVLSAYAREKGVRIVMHHETSSAVPSYERQMDAAYQYMVQHGSNTVKTGYVGHLLPRGHWHDDQWMINHYLRVAQRTAQYKIMLDAHEPVRPSGLHRTYPNWLACEASRGMEFNAWSKGNPPEHECILPFTRILGGPMDYTPGIFETRMSTYDPNKKEVVHTTVAKQLALYVTLYSPLQMAADLIENYEKRPDVFQFIKDVPVDWDQTVVKSAAVGDHIVIARKQKGKSDWYLGAITDENPFSTTIALDFLDKGRSYEASIYEDGPNAHWENNPYPVNIRKIKVSRGSKLSLNLAPGGGCAVSIKSL